MNETRQEKKALDPTSSPEDLAAAIGSVDWEGVPTSRIEMLGEVLTEHEAHAGGVTEAHREAWRCLKKAKRARLLTNEPHQNELVAWALSRDGRVLATGSTCGSDYEHNPDGMALWDVATGCCVHLFEGVRGGVGWPYQGDCIQWGPGDRRLGLAFDTNGVGYADPFDDHYVSNLCYVTDGWGSPPGWCWAPDGERLFIACWGYKHSSEPGCVVNPSENSGPIWMKAPPRKKGESPEVEPFSKMQWHAETNTVVGLSQRHKQAYAMNLDRRERVWLKSVSNNAALSDDGAKIATQASKQLVLLDGPTGDPLPLDEGIAGGRLMLFAPDNDRLAIADRTSVRIVRKGSIEAELEVVAADMNNVATPDLGSLAFSPDSQRLAVLSGNKHQSTATVWRLGANPEKLLEIDVSGCRGLFFGDGVVVGVAKNLLVFVDASSGRIIARHKLHDYPASDPFDGQHFKDEETARSVMTPLPCGEEGWVYLFNDRDVVVSGSPHAMVQAVADRRFVWPLAWSGVTIEPDIATAVLHHPDRFSTEIVEAYKATPEGKPSSGLPFPLENNATLDDLVDFLMDLLATLKQDSSQRDYYAKIALFHGRAGRYEAAIALLEHLRGGHYPSVLIPKILAHLAKAGADADLLLPHLQSAENSLDGAHESNRAVHASWCAAIRGILGHQEAARALWERAASESNKPSEAAEGVAVAMAFAGRIEEAFELVDGRYYQREIFDEIWAAVFESLDLDLIDRYLAMCAGTRGMSAHKSDRVMAEVVQACRDAGQPERAWGMAQYFEGLSTNGMTEQAAGHVCELRGVEPVKAMLIERIEEARGKGWLGPQGQLLAMWSRVVGEEGLEDQLSAFIRSINTLKIKSYNVSDVCAGLCAAYPLFSADELIKVYGWTKTTNAACWSMLAKTLPPDHPYWPTAFAKMLEHGSGGFYDGTLRLARTQTGLYRDTVRRMIEGAGQDRYELERLVEALAGEGDLVNAHDATMRLPRHKRDPLLYAMAIGALASGHYAAGIAVLSELEPGFGLYGSTYVAMNALLAAG